MNILISWSGPRSKAFAKCLRYWIGTVVRAAKPWMSTDMGPGRRWAEILAKKLESTHFGVVCVTPENQDEPWLLFEAGALSKSVGKSRIVPLLIDMPTDLRAPLNQFQAIAATKEGIQQLIESISLASGQSAIHKDILAADFEKSWRCWMFKPDARTIHSGRRQPSSEDG